MATKKQKENPKKITKFKIWLLENDINQNKLAERTSLSTNTINRLVNNGTASKSVIKLIAFELGITVGKLEQLLEFNNPEQNIK